MYTMAIRYFSKIKILNNLMRRSYPLFISAAETKTMSLKNLNFNMNYALHSVYRFKYDYPSKSSPSSEKPEDSDTDEEIDEIDKKHIIKIKVQSMRVDLVLRSSLGIARNKIEAAFYENRIRKNGKKIAKKSVSCFEGDEIDVIKMTEGLANPNNIMVTRIEILEINAKEDSILVTVKRFKNLTVEKYKD
ncbi:CLUMA_CG020105, isoform A [Clunio marinus]|uniref:CLUMA_CG020105, isoform A n=1 Tax=Clunio marinus TaxID=568069 RepID=A0A1J1J5Q1_9DIPT|nr:CLUMA_CG020105, isoform A [Clunio marinus]